METNNTKTIKDLKNDIKKLSELQRELKRHRKTEKFEGERMNVKIQKSIWNSQTRKYEKIEEDVQCTPDVAFNQHIQNRFELRMMNVAYGILRGRKLSQIENKSSEVDNLTEENHPLLWYKNEWSKIVQEYSGDEKTVCSD